eukprot:c24606_g1_i1 orf=315-1181(-)
MAAYSPLPSLPYPALTFPHARESPLCYPLTRCGMKSYQRTCSIPRLPSKEARGCVSRACLTSLSALALALVNSEKAFAAVDIMQLSVGLASLTPQAMYAAFVIEAIALVGAAVGGILARQRKQELEKLNSQLRKINEYMRSKAVIETYAPGLVYAPVGRPLDERRLDSDREELITLLKSGKKFLREKNPQMAYEEFKKALQLAQQIGDANEEKKAARGLGTSCQRQGKYREAITFHSMVLELSQRMGEVSGNTEALGSIADCYCELGDFDSAQKYYNRYIDRLTIDAN